MTGKEKLALAIKHENGPLLLDIGGFPTTGIHCSTLEKLRSFLGLEMHPIKIIEPMQLLGFVEDDVKEALGIQTTPLWGADSLFGTQQTDEFKEWRTPWGQNVLVSTEFVVSTDNRGDTLIYACADTQYPAAGRMPKDGYYFDVVNRAEEFDEDIYKIEDNYEEFGPISQASIDWLEKQAGAFKQTPDVVTGNLGSTAIGDIALVPGPQLRQPKGLRDITEWYISIISRPDILAGIFAYSTKYALENLEKMHRVLGDVIQAAYICGTDFGTQNGPFCSSEVFGNLYAPYYKQINRWIHENTTWKTFKHSCGSIEPLLQGMIDAEFDFINPVQWTAGGMDKKELKKKHGDKVVFWGGGIDTQKTLPFGTPQEVFNEALECCRIFGENGGYVFATIHNIQPSVPPENIVAMADAVRVFNGEK